jgi:hypothetical protein
MRVEEGKARDWLVSLEWVLKSLELIREHVEENDLVDVGEGGAVAVVGTDDEAGEDPLNSWHNLPTHVTRREVPRDELIRDGDNVPEVGRETESKHGELMAFQ